MKLARFLLIAFLLLPVAASSQVISQSSTAYSARAGAATTAATTLSTANASFYPSFVPSNSTNAGQALNVSTALSYNPNAQALTSTNFVGTLTGHSTLDLALTGGSLSGALTSNSVISGSELRIGNNTVSRVAYTDGGGGFTSGYNIFYNSGPVAVQNGTAAGVYYGSGGTTAFYNDSATTAGSALTATMTFFNNNTIVIAAPPGAAAGDTPICQTASHVIHGAAVTCGTSLKRDKKNIISLHEYIEQEAGVSCSDYLARMQAVKFAWRYNGSADIGFIADWTAKVDPLLGTYEGDKLTNVKDRAILSLTLCALQEEQVTRHAIEVRLSALEAVMVAR